MPHAALTSAQRRGLERRAARATTGVDGLPRRLAAAVAGRLRTAGEPARARRRERLRAPWHRDGSGRSTSLDGGRRWGRRRQGDLAGSGGRPARRSVAGGASLDAGTVRRAGAAVRRRLLDADAAGACRGVAETSRRARVDRLVAGATRRRGRARVRGRGGHRVAAGRLRAAHGARPRRRPAATLARLAERARRRAIEMGDEVRTSRRARVRTPRSTLVAVAWLAGARRRLGDGGRSRRAPERRERSPVARARARSTGVTDRLRSRRARAAHWTTCARPPAGYVGRARCRLAVTCRAVAAPAHVPPSRAGAHVPEVKPLQKVLDRQPRRDRRPGDPRLQGRRHRQRRRLRRARPRRPVRAARRRGPLPRRRDARPTPTSTSRRSSRSRRSPAPTRCTPATGSSPRTPTSPRPSSTPG